MISITVRTFVIIMVLSLHLGALAVQNDIQIVGGAHLDNGEILLVLKEHKDSLLISMSQEGHVRTLVRKPASGITLASVQSNGLIVGRVIPEGAQLPYWFHFMETKLFEHSAENEFIAAFLSPPLLLIDTMIGKHERQYKLIDASTTKKVAAYQARANNRFYPYAATLLNQGTLIVAERHVNDGKSTNLRVLEYPDLRFRGETPVDGKTLEFFPRRSEDKVWFRRYGAAAIGELRLAEHSGSPIIQVSQIWQAPENTAAIEMSENYVYWRLENTPQLHFLPIESLTGTSQDLGSGVINCDTTLDWEFAVSSKDHGILWEIKGCRFWYWDSVPAAIRTGNVTDIKKNDSW